MSKSISILGIFVADLTFRTERMPNKGETYIGNSFKLGPGGKGSNQAVAARRAGAETMFITKIGNDTFGEMAMKLYDIEEERKSEAQSFPANINADESPQQQEQETPTSQEPFREAPPEVPVTSKAEMMEQAEKRDTDT